MLVRCTLCCLLLLLAILWLKNLLQTSLQNTNDRDLGRVWERPSKALGSLLHHAEPSNALKSSPLRPICSSYSLVFSWKICKWPCCIHTFHRPCFYVAHWVCCLCQSIQYGGIANELTFTTQKHSTWASFTFPEIKLISWLPTLEWSDLEILVKH